MVIQRWQSVLMFVAAVLMAAVNFMPWGVIDGSIGVTPVAFPVMLTLNILTAVLLLVAIFMFRNMARQKTLVRISGLMIVVSALVGGLTVYHNEPSGSVDFCGGILAMAVAMVLTVWALVRIGADERLLKGADRIR